VGVLSHWLYEMLLAFYERYKLPMVITENGIATHADEQRIAAIKDYLAEVRKARTLGIPVLGYIHWSTFDNFEWGLCNTYQFG